MLSTAKTCSPAAGNSIFRQERGSSSAPSPLLSVSNTVSETPCKYFKYSPPRFTRQPSGMRSPTETPSPGRYFLLHPPRFPCRAPPRDSFCGESSGCSQKTLHANRRWRDVVVTGRGQEEVGCSRAAFRARRKYLCHHDLWQVQLTPSDEVLYIILKVERIQNLHSTVNRLSYVSD